MPAHRCILKGQRHLCNVWSFVSENLFFMFYCFFLPFDPTPPPHKNIFDLQDVAKEAYAHKRDDISEHQKIHPPTADRCCAGTWNPKAAQFPHQWSGFLFFPWIANPNAVHCSVECCYAATLKTHFLYCFFCMRNGGMTYCMNRWFTVEFGFNIL